MGRDALGLPKQIARTAVRYVITKFSGMHSLRNFLTHGAPLRARELHYYKSKYEVLQHCRKLVENKDLAKSHGDTLEKRGIHVDQLLNPSEEKDLKKIKYFYRVSFVLNCVRVFMPLYSSRWVLTQFLLRLKINKSITRNFLVRGGTADAEPETFFKNGCIANGQKWDESFTDYIREFRDYTKIDSSGPNSSESNSGELDSGESNSGESDSGGSDSGEPDSPILIDVAVKELVNTVEIKHNLRFLDKKFPLFGFMRDAATDTKNHPKLYLWRGEADAIAYSRKLEKYVVVDVKVVNDLLSYYEKKTVCGKHLHQCLLYAKLLKLHMGLEYLPPSLIVVIHQATGTEGYFPLFQDYPEECYEKLDRYEWFTEQPSKRPLRIVNTDKLLQEIYENRVGVFPPDTRLTDIFAMNATVKDLLDSLGYDSLEIFRQK